MADVTSKWRVRQRRIEQWWGHYRWFVIGGVWVAALCLGYVGFAKNAAARGQAFAPSDFVYLTVQLISMESGVVPRPVSWEFEVARWLLPAVTAYTAAGALLLLFREQLQAFRLQFIRDHVVICGLGQKGFLLARRFRARGNRVVIVERQDGGNMGAQCRAEGAIVLKGNAVDEAILRTAGVSRARYLIAVCGNDGTNIEVAMRAQELAKERRRTALTCLGHIVDAQLCELLREREIGTGKQSTFRLELFNVFDRGARLLLDECPSLNMEAGSQRAPHLLVIGHGCLGQSLVVHAARASWRRQSLSSSQIRITLVGGEAARAVELLSARYPKLASVCQLVPHQTEIDSADFERAQFLCDDQGGCAVDIIYVCLEDDSQSLHASLSLLRHLKAAEIPIIVRMIEDAGVGALLQGGDSDQSTGIPIRAFSLLERTCTPDLVLGGTHETIARAIHDEYLRSRRASGQAPGRDPAAVPWEELAAEYQESCRRQADAIGARLAAVGCGVTLLTDWDASLFTFDPDQVERMARMEHERWMAERLREGWTYGPRDPDRRSNPLLVPWEQLPEEARELNRNMVQELPAFLASVDLQIYRLPVPVQP
jgi:hypothetical protein